MKFFYLYGLSVILSSGCTNTSTETLNAGIFERKQLSGGNLMVYYAFAKNGLTFEDSAEIKMNTILEDSVKIQYQPKSSKKTIILLQ